MWSKEGFRPVEGGGSVFHIFPLKRKSEREVNESVCTFYRFGKGA